MNKSIKLRLNITAVIHIRWQVGQWPKLFPCSRVSLGVTLGGWKLYQWLAGVGSPISVQYNYRCTTNCSATNSRKRPICLSLYEEHNKVELLVVTQLKRALELGGDFSHKPNPILPFFSPGLWLPSQPQSIATLWPEPNYTGSLHRNML